MVMVLACAPVLEISAGSGAGARVPLGADARFSVTYWHSMYQAPFTEDYVIDARGSIRLDDLRSHDGTVLDYYALEGLPGEVRALNRRFSSLAFGIAARNPQTLKAGGRTWSFLEFGSAGTEIVLRAGSDCRIGKIGTR